MGRGTVIKLGMAWQKLTFTERAALIGECVYSTPWTGRD